MLAYVLLYITDRSFVIFILILSLDVITFVYQMGENSLVKQDLPSYLEKIRTCPPLATLSLPLSLFLVPIYPRFVPFCFCLSCPFSIPSDR